jgi:tetratricopeptide (TPR) repeat protein
VRTYLEQAGMTEPNVLLDALIEQAGFSHAGFAARINQHGNAHGMGLHYDHASVARWLRDYAIPRGRVPEIICEILSSQLGRPVSLSAVGFDRGGGDLAPEVPLSQAVSRAAAFWRSEARRPPASDGRPLLNGPGAIAPVFEWENPPEDQDVSSSHGRRAVTAADVLIVVEARARYEQMYRRVGGTPVRPRVIEFLNGRVAPLLRESYDDATGRRLLRAAGGLVAIAGICMYDTDRQATAQRYFFDSLRLAKASGDRGFGGYIVALLANQSMCMGRYRQVIQYAETAIRGAQGALSPALTSDLCTLQAKAYARMGHRAQCHEQMHQAESMAGRIRLSEEPPETGYVQPGLAELQHAEALRQLGDLTAAQTYAEQALTTADQCHLRSQVHRFATLAMILAARGEPEAAADAGHRMLARAHGMESHRIRDRVAGVARAIGAGGDTLTAREFAERAKDQLTAPM